MASLTLTGSLALWMVWGSTQSTIVPHVIEVSALHETGEIWRIPRSALLTAPASKPTSAP
jgi:type IV secretory pathway TrbF-like protein